MSQAPPLPPVGGVFYPESDGKPMADNTKQFRWISVLQGNIAALYRDAPDVFVAGDLFWYAVEGDPEAQKAPDVMVVFGRPKGDRGSYRQWEEDGVAPQVVFEILSPENTHFEMADKLAFYDEHGVEEYYVYDPDRNSLLAYRRGREALRRVWPPEALVSPRLGIRFDLSGPEMQVFYPDGRRFLTFEELEADRTKQAQLRKDAEQKLHAAEQKLQTTEGKLHAAEEKLQTVEGKLHTAEEGLQTTQQRVRRLSELGRKARQGQATPEELAELERLEKEAEVP
jgi:Uma2 family endonuclease